MPRDNRPRLSVVAVIDNLDHVLIGARRRGKYKGTYVLPGGGVEVGETLDEALVREVMEETGVTVRPSIGVIDVVEMVGKKAHRVLLIKRGYCDPLAQAVDTDELMDVHWHKFTDLPYIADRVQPWVMKIFKRLGFVE